VARAQKRNSEQHEAERPVDEELHLLICEMATHR